MGPVPGDSGAGATNYGYLYNFPAATVGEPRTTLPAGTGAASHSICPAGWKLPTGRDVTGDFAFRNAKMFNSAATAGSTAGAEGYYQNWQYNGPFKGVSTGYWDGGFYLQGSYRYLWSASDRSGNVSQAHYATFTASYVTPGSGTTYRHSGSGIRCLLN